MYLPGQGSFARIGDLDISGNQLTVEAQINMTGQFIYVLRGSTFCGVFTKSGPLVLIR